MRTRPLRFAARALPRPLRAVVGAELEVSRGAAPGMKARLGLG